MEDTQNKWARRMTARGMKEEIKMVKNRTRMQRQMKKDELKE